MNDWYYFLFVLVATWVTMMVITFGSVLCEQRFSGVWSSIVIDDCFGSFRSPTAALPGGDGWLVHHNATSGDAARDVL